MSRTHLVTTPTVNIVDLPVHLSEVADFELSAFMLSSLVNDADFMVKQCVSAARRYIVTEVLEIEGNQDEHSVQAEIASAVAELNLAEISFFEAGNDRPSMIDLVQHLAELRPAWIELAKEADAFHQAERSTVSSLWAAANRLTFNPPSLEDQFVEAEFKLSSTKEDRIRRDTIIATQQVEGINDSKVLEARAEENVARTRVRLKKAQDNYLLRAPVNIAIYNAILKADCSTQREQVSPEIVGAYIDGEFKRLHPTQKVERTFATLPKIVRLDFFRRAEQNLERKRGWVRDSASDSRWIVFNAVCNKLMTEIQSTLKGSQFAALRAAESV